jgi:UDP-glucose 4-epimerase
MRVLVSGGAGYIGSVVAALLVEGGHDVTVIDDLSTGHADAVPDGARLVKADLLNRAAVLDAMAPGFDGVVHLAAKSLVAESAREPELYFRHNLGTALNLLDAMRATGVRQIVFSSTAAVYGEPDTVPITEDSPTRPTNAYGASKLAIDQLLSFAARAHGIAGMSFRYFNVGGAYGRYGERHTEETHLIPRILDVAAGRGEAVEVYGTDYPTPDGTAIRDYIHVTDLAAAHVAALKLLLEGHVGGSFNLGTGAGFSVREILSSIRQETGREVPHVIKPRRAGDPTYLVADPSGARKVLNFVPRHSDLPTIIRTAWAWHQTAHPLKTSL